MHRLVALTLPAVLFAAPALAQTPDAAPIVAAERAFAADAPSMGIAGSFNKWSVPEAIVIGGGQAQRIGEAYPDGPRPADEPLLEWWPNFAGIARSGDLGFTTGGVAVNGRRTGHYFTVWKKQPDGSWRWVYDGGSGASAADVPGPDSEPVILPVGPQLLQVVTSMDRPPPPMAPDWAMTRVREQEAALARAAVTDQKAAHLAAMADNGRLYVAPRPPAIGRDAVCGGPGRLARDVPFRADGGRRAVAVWRPRLDLWAGRLDPRRTGADRPLCAPLAKTGGGVPDRAGAADSGPAARAPSRRELNRPISIP